MEIKIDCDEDEIILTDEMADNGYIQLGIHRKSDDARFTFVNPKELAKALRAFL